MAYFIRDDRVTPDEARRLNYGRSPASRIMNTSPKLTSFRDAEGKHVFIHAAPTVMHDACVRANIPGVHRDENTHEAVNASFAASDGFADRFGPGHALCWDRLWTNDQKRAPDCYFCGKAVVGIG